MSHGPMVSAAALLRVKRERDTLLWVLTLLLAGKMRASPEQVRKRARAPMFDYKMRQAGERDDA